MAWRPLTEWTVDFESADPRNEVSLSNGTGNCNAGITVAEELDLPTRVGRTSSEEECADLHISLLSTEKSGPFERLKVGDY